MEVKNFFEHLKSKEEDKPEFFFVLHITPEMVKSAVWWVENQKVKIAAVGEEVVWSTSEELLLAADTSLSAAVSRLNLSEEALEPSRVIFGLPPSWVVEDKIVEEKMTGLKELSQKLELKPAGFVVVPEAMVYYLKAKEGVPPTAILVAIEKKHLLLSLVNLGKVNVSEEIDRSDNFGADLAEGLSRLGSNSYFPPRIILYDGKEKIDDLAQELLAYSWAGAGINFLHLPKVEVLAANIEVLAVALAGGQELAQAVGVVEEVVVSEGPAIERQLVEPEAGSVEEVQKPPSVAEPWRVSWRGLALWQRLKCRIKVFGQAPKIARIVVIVLGLIAGIIFWGYWNWPSAEVVLETENKFLEKNVAINLDPKATALEVEKMTLPVRLTETETTGEKSSVTTGKKTTGEAAKGEVKIYNNTVKEKKLSAGTVLTSSAGLKFALEQEATVPAHSSALEAVPSISVQVVAMKFGADYNLAAGTEFAVANLAKSDLAAKNESPFTGGNSQEVAAVAAKDQEKLLSDLSEELKSQAFATLQKEIPAGRQAVDKTLTLKVISKDFDKKVEEEADKINLKLKLKIGVMSYQDTQMTQLIDQEISRLIPTGYQFDPQKREINLEVKSGGKDTVASIEAQVKIGLRPEFDLTALAKNVAGKQLDLGRSYLVNLPNVKSVEIKMQPVLPAKLATFPHRWERIKIHLVGK